MAFSARFYNVAADPRALDKGIDPNGGTLVTSIRPTENCDILNPRFELDYKASLTTCNYVVVGAPFNRSYFITDISIDIGKKIYISCAVDVLETYKDQIKGITANVIRQERLTEPYLPDSEYKIKSGFQNETYSWLSQTGNRVFAYTPYYILNVMGGSANYGFISVGQEPADWALNWGDYYVNVDDEWLRLFGVYAYDPGFQTVINEYGRVYKRIKI